MERIEALNKHLNSLTAVNQDNAYNDDIRDTVDEINKELGIGKDKALETYTAKELHEELNKRTNVFGIEANLADEIIVSVITGDVESLKKSYKGPARVLINQD